jgi:hypothetical protein
MHKSTLVGAFGAFAAIAAAPHALSAPLEGFGLTSHGRCRLCEPSLNLKKNVTVAIPEHAIVLDFGNGAFWRNDPLVVVDLDQAEARTYRFPPEEQQPTKLTLVGTKAISSDVMRNLISKANVIWAPPPLQGPPRLHVTDVFETVYVVNGPVMASWLGGSDDPAWFVVLKEAIRPVEAG